jgi:hypothetical protein
VNARDIAIAAYHAERRYHTSWPEDVADPFALELITVGTPAAQKVVDAGKGRRRVKNLPVREAERKAALSAMRAHLRKRNLPREATTPDPSRTADRLAVLAGGDSHEDNDEWKRRELRNLLNRDPTQKEVEA